VDGGTGFGAGESGPIAHQAIVVVQQQIEGFNPIVFEAESQDFIALLVADQHHPGLMGLGLGLTINFDHLIQAIAHVNIATQRQRRILGAELDNHPGRVAVRGRLDGCRAIQDHHRIRPIDQTHLAIATAIPRAKAFLGFTEGLEYPRFLGTKAQTILEAKRSIHGIGGPRRNLPTGLGGERRPPDRPHAQQRWQEQITNQ
jgi:hypothetical protein